MRRHFTASGYVAHRGRVLLHWHRKLNAFLPPGGHVEPDEDPVTAVLREALEETGLTVEVMPRGPNLGVERPAQLPAPEAVMLEDIDDPEAGPHQHVDLIYFCRPVGPIEGLKDGWVWVSGESLARREAVVRGDGVAARLPEDVRRLALAALSRAAACGS